MWGVASVAGPLVGGYVTDAISWRWVFYLNLPFGLLALLVIALTYPKRQHTGTVKGDWLGAALIPLWMRSRTSGPCDGAGEGASCAYAAVVNVSAATADASMLNLVIIVISYSRVRLTLSGVSSPRRTSTVDA